MAHENLYTFVDHILKNKDAAEYSFQIPEQDTRYVYLSHILFAYYHTTLQPSKYKTQRDHCRKAIEILCPAISDGFFKKLRKQKGSK